MVQFSLTQKGWAKIQRVITSNTTEFIGKVFKRGKRFYTSPIGFEHDLKIIVRDRKVGKIEEGYYHNNKKDSVWYKFDLAGSVYEKGMYKDCQKNMRDL